MSEKRIPVYTAKDIITVDDIRRGDMMKLGRDGVVGCSAFSGADYESVLSDAMNDTGYGIVKGIADDRCFRVEKGDVISIMPYIIIRQKKPQLLSPRHREIFDSILLTLYIDKVISWMEENGHDTSARCIPEIAEYLFWHFNPEKELESEIERLYIDSLPEPEGFIRKLQKAREDDSITPVSFLVEVLANAYGTGYSSWIDECTYDSSAELSFAPEFERPTMEERMAENIIRGTLTVIADPDGYGPKPMKPTMESWEKFLRRLNKDEKLKDIRDAYLDEADDAETADAILQLWLLDDINFS